MAKNNKPRSGSMAFYPKKKAKRIYPSFRSIDRVNSIDKTAISGFAGYKTGMTHVIALDNREKSPSFGQQIAVPCTVLETPSIFVFGFKAYQKTLYGTKAVSQVLAEKPPKDLWRVLRPVKKNNRETNNKKIQDLISSVSEFRLLAAMQPRKISLKKTPELFEIPLSGSVGEQYKLAQDKLGKELAVKDVFAEGDFLDVIGITKGQGTQGPVTRFGIKIQHHKAKPHRRRPGNLGAWHPARVLYTVAMAGQLGFQRRTELNKLVLKIGDAAAASSVNPQGGFPHYGLVNNDFMLIQGSVPGPKKRLVMMRKALRMPERNENLQVSMVSTASQQ